MVPDVVAILEEGQVPGQGGGVARNIDNPPGGNLPEGLYHLGVHAGPGRVGDDHIGARLAAGSQGLPEALFQISRQELAIFQAVEPAVGVGIVHGRRDQFKSHHPAHLRGQVQGDAAGPAIEIPDGLLTG